MRYLLDTNLIMIYSRRNQYSEEIERRFSLFNGSHQLHVSTIILGELNALIKKWNLGGAKVQHINSLLGYCEILGIDDQVMIDNYGDIDAYSQGKGESALLPRNMGKNDIWIAATALSYDLHLITTDKDFRHLGEFMIDLTYIDLEEIGSS